MKNLPAQDTVLKANTGRMSVKVLAKVKGFDWLMIARYSHAIDAWQVEGVGGWPKVVEWWPMPEIGTGNK